MDKEQKNLSTVKPDNQQPIENTSNFVDVNSECDLQKVIKPEILDL